MGKHIMLNELCSFVGQWFACTGRQIFFSWITEFIAPNRAQSELTMRLFFVILPSKYKIYLVGTQWICLNETIPKSTHKPSFSAKITKYLLTLDLLNLDIPSAFANSVDPDQLASKEADWSGSALFVIQYVNLYQQPWSSSLIGWKLVVGVAS